MLRTRSERGFPAGKKGRMVSLVPWASPDVLSSSSQKKSPLLLTQPSKTCQSYLFPLDSTVEQACVRKGISLGQEFSTDRPSLWDGAGVTPGQAVAGSPAKRQHESQGAGEQEERRTEDFLGRQLRQGIFFLHVRKRSVCL